MKHQKFRASVYIDVWIDPEKETDDADAMPELKSMDEMRAEAEAEVEEMITLIPNKYIGGVATMSELMGGKEI